MSNQFLDRNDDREQRWSSHNPSLPLLVLVSPMHDTEGSMVAAQDIVGVLGLRWDSSWPKGREL